MRTVLLVSEDDALGARLLRALSDCSIFPSRTDDHALRTLRLTEVDLILKQVASPPGDLESFIAKARQLRPTAVIVCILPADGLTPDDELAVEGADFALLQPFTTPHLRGVLRQADEKLLLLQEVAALRTARRPVAMDTLTEDADAAPEASARDLTQVAREFAKALAAGFDLPRVLDLFLDAVSELARPSRSAILLAEDEHRQYRVRASRGLARHLVDSVSLSADSGLSLWLMTEGRLIQIDEAQARATESAGREIAREMAVLQAVVAIPLASHGELVGILLLGQRISGGTYNRRDVETLFNLASPLATAIRDIRVHHQLQYQKEFTERILQRMSSGVITIGPEQRVVMMNRRAEEILGMAAKDVLNRDLRVLPSPLGDLLYESLSRGSSARSEIQLALHSLPLEVSTYPVMGEGTAPMGAVVVFEDLTAQRQLAQERRSAEQLQLLTRVVARIADEIKNPLVSINAFMELLGERYDDVSFRQHFTAVVGRDVRRLVQLFDKLAALVNEGDYKRDIVDMRTAIEECLVEMGVAELPAAPAPARLLTFTDETTQKLVTVNFSYEGNAFLVKGDRAMLKKAVAYLIWYLLRRTPGQEAKIAVAVSHPAAEENLRITVASRTAEIRPDELLAIFDPIQVVQENLIDVGPCVSQRILEAQSGRLEVKQGRAEVTFTAMLPAAHS